jgi:hypothetical protein
MLARMGVAGALLLDGAPGQPIEVTVQRGETATIVLAS